MLIEKINGANGTTKKIRITEEFGTLLFVNHNEETFDDIMITVFIERAGKNIPLINRCGISKIMAVSGVIELTPYELQDISNSKYYPISLFENGNFKLNDSDACVIEIEGIKTQQNASLYGLPDMEACTALYNYEEKNILVGEHTKTFDLKGVERVAFPQGIKDCQIGFIMENEKGNLVERKFEFPEFIYSVLTQKEVNPFNSVAFTTGKSYAHLPYVLVVDGIRELKIYSKTDRTEILNFLFQSKYNFTGNSVSSVKSLVNTATLDVIGNVGSGATISSDIGTIGTGLRFS